MTIHINHTPVGTGHPAYLVAELSGNHNRDLGRAEELIHAAAEAGANAVKLQTYTADTITIDSNRPEFTITADGPWRGRTLHDLYEESHTPWSWHPRLFAEARARGLDVFSSPFDPTAVDLLESLDAPAYKVASFELVDDPLLRRIGATGKPVILSTGMADLEEIVHAVGILRSAGSAGIVVLKCTSSYPAPDDTMNLASLPRLAEVTDCPVGLSDHSMGTVAAVVAVTLGACLVEKHLTLRRADGGVDSSFSLEPDEFRALVDGVRQAEAMIGEATFGPSVAEAGNTAFRRSLYVVEDVPEGGIFTEENVRSIRPGFGLAPRYLELVLGRRALRPVARGTPMSWELVVPS
jgi:N-acetylneuraminate synthase